MYTARLIVLHPTRHKPGSQWATKPHAPMQEHVNDLSVTGLALGHLQHARGLQLERTTGLICTYLRHDYSMQAVGWPQRLAVYGQ